MSSRDFVLSAMRDAGERGARSLREQAADMTGTEIIEKECYCPDFDPERDYTGYPVGAPVADGGQVWQLLQPHNAGHYTGRPGTLRALWGLCHTRNPAKAKPYVAPHGTSGLYAKGECCTDPNAADPKQVYRAVKDGADFPPSQYAAYWEAVEE